MVLKVPTTEASSMIRSEPPGDDEENCEIPVWAGVIPVQYQFLPPEIDPHNLARVRTPCVTRPDNIINFNFG